MSRSRAAANRAPRGFLNSGLSVNAGRAPGLELRKSRLSAVSAGRWPVGLFTISGASMATRQSSPVNGAMASMMLGVILRGTDVEESAVGVDGRDTGLVFLAPREIESNEVHGATVPCAYPRRKLCSL